MASIAQVQACTMARGAGAALPPRAGSRHSAWRDLSHRLVLGVQQAARWGVTEVSRKSSDTVERASAEEMATEVEDGSGTEIGPAGASALHALLDQVLGGA
jgi:hypothetical protein